MSNKQEKKPAPLASILNEPKEDFSFQPNEFAVIRFNLSVLSDFKKTNLLTLRKVFKNIAAINGAQAEREEELKELSASVDQKDVAKVAELKNLAESQLTVSLFTLNMEDFPTERSDFGTRNYSFSATNTIEVDYVVSFLELLEVGLIKE